LAPLQKKMRVLKPHATRLNKLLGPRGRGFWEEESFDT